MGLHDSCPKCGCWQVQTRYCSVCRFQKGEHLHRECGGCGYAWVEPTLDAGRQARYWEREAAKF